MEYQVPQFIEVEDKIVGPLTLKQFVYIAGTGGICVALVMYLPLVFAILCAAPIAALGLTLAFYKINGKPFIDVLEAAFSYYTGSKLFLWKHVDQKVGSGQGVGSRDAQPSASKPGAVTKAASRLTRGKLSELAWSLDVQKQQAS